jgi:phage gpG-like protein
MKNNAPNFKKIANGILADLPRYASVTALNFFQDSFVKQGWDDGTFTAWSARKGGTDSGRAVLTDTSYLQNELRIAQAAKRVVRIVNDAPYASIHNNGGTVTIPITDKMRKYFWAKFKETGENRYKAMALTKKRAFTFVMPQRQFMGNSRTLLTQLDKWLLNQLQTRFKRG